MTMDLPEWHGLATPAVIAARVTTTTLDPLSEALMMDISTSPKLSTAEQLTEYFPLIIAALSLGGCASLLLIIMFLGREQIKSMGSAMNATSRLMAFYKSDPIEVYMPSGEMPKSKSREAPLPPLRPWHEIEKERADLACNQGLENAISAINQRGPRGLCLTVGDSGPVEEAPLRMAMRSIRERKLDGEGKNAQYLAKGEKWLATLAAERALVAAAHTARPELDVIGKTMTQSPLVGAPWLTTTVGRTVEGEIQRASWQKIEHLTEVIRVAASTDASDMLVKQALELRSALIARTPELPSDRCVLDPEGEGIKLLPMGKQRAVWTFSNSGDTYVYDSQTRQAAPLEEPPPPRAQLGDVGVDEARPVCAEWAKHRRCKAGKRCPWRHTTPQAGDSIRECILFAEDV